MISNNRIKEEVLPLMLQKTRKLEYYLVKSIIENVDQELLQELLKFQNEDGGFGHGLEVDIQMPHSNIASTDMAVEILKAVKDQSKITPVIQQIVQYYETQFQEDIEGWYMVPKEVDDYPRAVWWNFENRHTFTYGNPNPEIIGFLYEHREFCQKLDINHLINNVVSYIKGPFLKEASMHSLLSVLRFYHSMDNYVRNMIIDTIHTAIDQLISTDPSEWNSYSLEPYKIAFFGEQFVIKHNDVLNKNLDHIDSILQSDIIQPKHHWMQYEEIEKNVLQQWSGYFTYVAIKALRYRREES